MDLRPWKGGGGLSGTIVVLCGIVILLVVVLEVRRRRIARSSFTNGEVVEAPPHLVASARQESELNAAVTEEARRQAVIDDLARRYEEDERRELAEAEARRLHLVEQGRRRIHAARESLLDGDHRAAWLALHDPRADRQSNLAAAEVVPDFCLEIRSDDTLHATAIELALRIDWSGDLERERASERRHIKLVEQAGLVDFGELDRRLCAPGTADNRPTVVGVIYSITMPDGEVYVGRTVRAVECRWAEHRREALSGDRKPKSRALRYWVAQGRDADVQWRVEERVLGWDDQDLAAAERRWMRMATLNVMDASRAATLYPDVGVSDSLPRGDA